MLADVPMLIAWGMKDFVFDRHFLAEWVRRFPEAEVHRFAEAGHYVLEDEAEEIVPLVRAFLVGPSRCCGRWVDRRGRGPDREIVNIASHLPAMAASRPYAPAVVCPAGRDRAGRARVHHWTFRQLDRESDLIAARPRRESGSAGGRGPC